MNYALAILGVLLIVLVGDLAFKIVTSDSEINHSFELRVALGWSLGTGFLTLVVFYASLIHSSTGYLTAIIVFTVLAVIRILTSLIHHPITIGLSLVRTRTLIKIILLAMITAAIWSVSARAGLGFDGISNWGFKAKDSFLHGGWQLLTPAYKSLPFPDYPLLVPTLQGWIYTFTGNVDEEVVKILFVYFYVAMALLFYSAIRSQYYSVMRTIFTLLMASTPLLAISALMAYADVPMMLFLFGSVFFLWRWLNSENKLDVILGSLLASFTLLVKRDSAVHWVATFGIILILSSIQKKYWLSFSRIKQLLIYPTLGFLISGSWFLFLSIGKIHITSFDSPTLFTLIKRTSRLPIVLEAYLNHFSTPLEWGLLWFLFVGVTLWQRHKLKNKAILFVWLMTLLPMLFTATGILISSDAIFSSHVTTAVNRLIMHTVPTAWFYVALSTTELDVWLQSMIAQRNDSVKGRVGQ